MVLGLQTACGQGRNENCMGKEGLLRAAWMSSASKVQSSACCAMRIRGLLGKSISAALVPSCTLCMPLPSCCSTVIAWWLSLWCSPGEGESSLDCLS